MMMVMRMCTYEADGDDNDNADDDDQDDDGDDDDGDDHDDADDYVRTYDDDPETGCYHHRSLATVACSLRQEPTVPCSSSGSILKRLHNLP